MKTKQISIFLENKGSCLYEISALLGRCQIAIRAVNVAEAADYSVLRLVVDQPDYALCVLEESGFVASLAEVVIVEVSDQPGSLAGVLNLLLENDLKIDYLYGFFEKGPDTTLIVFRIHDPDAAVELFVKKKIPMAAVTEIGE